MSDEPGANGATDPDRRERADDGAAGIRIDPALVRELVKLLNDTDLTDIEVEDGPRRIRVARQPAPVHAAPAYAPAPVPTAAPAPVPTAAPAAAAPSGATAPAEEPGAVMSPMVGTAYLAAEPGAAPFATVGATVAEGTTIMIVEAMKVMNPITAPRAGTLTRLFVDNGQPVEFGQPLFAIV